MVELVGRQRELAEARAALAAALSGAGGLLLVTGEAGIGKSALIAALIAEQAGQAGQAAQAGQEAPLRTLWGTCLDDPGTPPYWPWTMVARAVGARPGPELAPLLGTAGPEPGGSGPAEQQRWRLFDALAGYLTAAAGQTPLVIVLEDLHDADQASLDLLRFLATSLRGQPVALVGSHRYPDFDPGSPLAAALPELARTARTVALPGLGYAEVGALVGQVTGVPAGEQLVRRVLDRTGGNPLFVTEICRLLVTQGPAPVPAPDPLPLPPGVRQVIGQRVGLLGGAVRDLLAEAAVVGQVFTAPLLVRLTGYPPGRVADLLAEAAGAGLVAPLPALGEYGFTHALVREVLYAGLPAAGRRAGHRRVAEAIEALHQTDLDPQLDQLADHLVLALPDADPVLALRYSRRAGDRAMARLAYAQAARHYAHAARLAESTTDIGAERAELLLGLGEARLRAGDQDGAAGAYQQVADLARQQGRPDQLARAALGFGAGLSGLEVRLFDQRQLDLLAEALAALPDDQPRLRAWVLARLAVAESFVAADEVRVAHSQEALALARAAGDPKLLAYALSSYCDAVPGPEHSQQRLVLAQEMVRLGVAAGDAESELLGRRFRVVALLEQGDIREVDAEIEAFARTAARLRWPLVQWWPVMWRGMRALIEGRLDDAERLAGEARELGQRGGSTNAVLTADYSLLPYVALERGQLEVVAALVEQMAAEAEAGPDLDTWTVLPLVRMGRHAQARAVLDRLTATGFPLQPDGSWLDKVAALAEAGAALGHTDAARALWPVISPYPDLFSAGGTATCCAGSLSRFLGLLAGCLGERDQADAYFQRALAAHRRAGAPLLVAHTLRQHAELLRTRDRPGDAQAAQAAQTEADATYRQLGLDHWVSTPESKPAEATSDGEFRRDGDTWLLRYQGRAARVRDTKGLATLARLLAEPGRELHVFDLLGAAGPATGTGEVIDDQARRAYQRRLQELAEEIDGAQLAGDPVRAERAEQERTALVEQLAAAYGLGGRARHGNDPVERARSTVAKRIHGAIARIEAHHPALARHLTNSVRTGRFCAYVPETPVRWELAPPRPHT